MVLIKKVSPLQQSPFKRAASRFNSSICHLHCVAKSQAASLPIWSHPIQSGGEPLHLQGPNFWFGYESVSSVVQWTLTLSLQQLSLVLFWRLSNSQTATEAVHFFPSSVKILDEKYILVYKRPLIIHLKLYQVHHTSFTSLNIYGFPLNLTFSSSYYTIHSLWYFKCTYICNTPQSQ